MTHWFIIVKMTRRSKFIPADAQSSRYPVRKLDRKCLNFTKRQIKKSTEEQKEQKLTIAPRSVSSPGAAEPTH